jgi:hypothetical protein
MVATARRRISALGYGILAASLAASRRMIRWAARMESGAAKESVMVRFLHPLAFFSVILLLVGLIVVGADNVVLCANGCSPSVSDLRAQGPRWSASRSWYG